MKEYVEKLLNGTNTIITNIDKYIEGFVLAYGEDRREEITNKFKNMFVIGYLTNNEKKSLIDKTIKEESLKYQEEFLNSLNISNAKEMIPKIFGFGHDYKNLYHINGYINYKKEMAKGIEGRKQEFLKEGYEFIKRYLNISYEEYIDNINNGIGFDINNKLPSYVKNNILYYCDLNNADNDLNRYRKQAISFLNELGFEEDDIDNHYLLEKYNDINKIADNIDRLNNKLDSEFEYLKPYEDEIKYIDKLEVEIDLKYKKILLQNMAKYFTSKDKEQLEELLKKDYIYDSELKKIMSYKIFVSKGNGKNPLIESFSKENEDKLNNISTSEWIKNTIMEERIEYFKAIGIDLGDNYSDYINNDKVKESIPPAYLANEVMNIINDNKNQKNIEIFEANPINKKIKEEIERKGYLDKDISFNARLNNNPITCVNPNVIYESGKYKLGGLVLIHIEDSNSLDHYIVHELNHVLELSLTSVNGNKYQGICGWDILSGDINQQGLEEVDTLSKDNNKRNYELFNEIINELLAQKVSEMMEQNDLFIFNTKDNNKYKNTTSYERMRPFVIDFFDEYLPSIIDSRKDGNISSLFNEIGEKNFNDLNNLLIRFNELFSEFRFYALAKAKKEGRITDDTMFFDELMKEKDMILENMRNYKKEMSL